jgi:hypothetical protein
MNDKQEKRIWRRQKTTDLFVVLESESVDVEEEQVDVGHERVDLLHLRAAGQEQLRSVVHHLLHRSTVQSAHRLQSALTRLCTSDTQQTV